MRTSSLDEKGHDYLYNSIHLLIAMSLRKCLWGCRTRDGSETCLRCSAKGVKRRSARNFEEAYT